MLTLSGLGRVEVRPLGGEARCMYGTLTVERDRGDLPDVLALAQLAVQVDGYLMVHTYPVIMAQIAVSRPLTADEIAAASAA